MDLGRFQFLCHASCRACRFSAAARTFSPKIKLNVIAFGLQNNLWTIFSISLWDRAGSVQTWVSLTSSAHIIYKYDNCILFLPSTQFHIHAETQIGTMHVRFVMQSKAKLIIAKMMLNKQMKKRLPSIVASSTMIRMSEHSNISLNQRRAEKKWRKKDLFVDYITVCCAHVSISGALVRWYGRRMYSPKKRRQSIWFFHSFDVSVQRSGQLAVWRWRCFTRNLTWNR